MMSLQKLFNEKRLSQGGLVRPTEDLRTPFEHDFDRILFAAPVRRLADKTQVFPLERNDSVRNRLTHSHEVANLCRSVVTQLVRKDEYVFGTRKQGEDAATIGAAVGLAHDLGNPPFGHQGEKAIQRWFAENLEVFCHEVKDVKNELKAVQKTDFLSWEGNAQAFRLLTRLQLSKGKYGLDLTYATLSALMKYTVSSNETDDLHPAHKKFGYFQADKENALSILNAVGLSAGKRHPIAYIMEACDDIAYSVIDIEDAIKKGIVSINDVIAAIKQINNFAPLAEEIEGKINKLENSGRSPSEINDIGAQYYRTFCIRDMILSTIEAFFNNKNKIISGDLDEPLIKKAGCNGLCKGLKAFAFKHAYSAPSVKEIELRGDNLLHRLMNYFWRAIRERGHKNILPIKTTPFGEFVFSHLSDNYVRCFNDSVANLNSVDDFAEIRYNQLLLLTDMVSGMTENFAIDLDEKFSKLDDHKKG